MPPRVDFASQRLFVDHALAGSAAVALTKEQSNYLVSVLRMRAGDGLLVFNGRDGEWRATLSTADRKAAMLTIGERTRAQTPPTGITLAFAPLKQARLDYMVQKAVEMGAGTLLAVQTRRTQVEIRNEDRIRANIIEAAEQCGVLAIPDFAGSVRLDKLPAMLASTPDMQIVFCDEMADVVDPQAALSSLPHGTPVTVLIGPEGGFTPEERATILSWPRSHAIALGPRILRADTAAVAALAAVQLAVGDWRV
jgi:16S rRNA (uracil1498-N3)-methyltransferase